MKFNNYLFLLFCFIFLANSYSQECGIINHIDEKSKYKEALFDLNDRIYHSELHEILPLLNSLRLPDSNSTPSYKLSYFYFWGEYNYRSDEFEKAEKNFKNVLSISQKIGETYFVYASAQKLSHLSDSFESAHYYFSLAEEYCVDLEYSDLYYSLLISNLNICCKFKSIGYSIQDSLIINIKSKIEKMIEQELSKSERDYLDDFSLFMYYNVAGQCTYSYNEAISILKKSLNSVIKYGQNQDAIEYSYFLIAEKYFQFNKYDSSFAYIDKFMALKHDGEFESSEQLFADTRLFITEKDYKKAEEKFKQLNTILIGLFGDEEIYLANLGYEIYSALEMYKEANVYLKKKHKIELEVNTLKGDSLVLAFEHNSKDLLGQLDFITEKNELKNQRLVLIIFALSLFLILILFYHFYTKKQLEQQRKFSQLENNALRKELVFDHWKVGFEKLGIQLKYPIQNSKLIIDNLIQTKNYNAKTFNELIFLLKSNQTKLINSINNIILSAKTNQFYNYFEIQPSCYLGLGFITKLVEQIKILTGPKHIPVEIKHRFKKETTCSIKDTYIEYIICEQIQLIVEHIDSLTKLDIELERDSNSSDKLLIKICAKTPFSYKIDQLLEIKEQMNTSFTTINGCYKSDEHCIHYVISTCCNLEQESESVNTLTLKPSPISESILASHSFLMINSNQLVTDVFINIKKDIEIKSMSMFLNNFSIINDQIDLLIFYSDHLVDSKLFINKLEACEIDLPPILFIDYHNHLEKIQTSEEMSKMFFVINSLNVPIILNSIFSLLSTGKDQQTISSPFDNSSQNEGFVNLVVKFIHKNLENTDYKLKDLATDVFYSERQLQRLIKQKTGMPISKLILEIKLKEAFNLLIQDPIIRVQEVQFMVGFKSSSHFSKAFKERFGFPPGQLRA